MRTLSGAGFSIIRDKIKSLVASLSSGISSKPAECSRPVFLPWVKHVPMSTSGENSSRHRCPPSSPKQPTRAKHPSAKRRRESAAHNSSTRRSGRPVSGRSGRPSLAPVRWIWRLVLAVSCRPLASVGGGGGLGSGAGRILRGAAGRVRFAHQRRERDLDNAAHIPGSWDLPAVSPRSGRTRPCPGAAVSVTRLPHQRTSASKQGAAHMCPPGATARRCAYAFRALR